MSRGHPAQLRQCFLIKLFKKLGYDPKLAFAEVKILLRHKWAAPYAIQVGQEEQQVKIKLGFSEVRIFKKELCSSDSSLDRSLRFTWGNLYSQQDLEFPVSD